METIRRFGICRGLFSEKLGYDDMNMKIADILGGSSQGLYVVNHGK